LKVTAIVPAYNEADRILAVLKAVTGAGMVDEVVVVSDGSTDATYEIAAGTEGVRAIRLDQNRGKAAAMCAGARETDADCLVFLDADLIGLRPEHVNSIVRPVAAGEAEMCVGVFKGGRMLTDLAQKIAPVISGQRAILRARFLSIPGLEDVRMGVEIALTRWAQLNGIATATVTIPGVTHTMKEEKLGALRGFAARLRMYLDIGRVMLDGHRLRTDSSRNKLNV